MSITTEQNFEENLSKTSIGKSGVTLRPFVDILEDKEQVVLKADIPGVSRENLSIEVNGDKLVIEGQINKGPLDKNTFKVVKMRADVYRRTFTLGKDIDSDNIVADLKSGLLTLILPKKSEVLPRKITVNAA